MTSKDHRTDDKEDFMTSKDQGINDEERERSREGSKRKLRRGARPQSPLREIKTLVSSRKGGMSSTILYWNVKVFRGKDLIECRHFVETLRTEELYKERPYLKEIKR